MLNLMILPKLAVAVLPILVIVVFAYGSNNVSDIIIYSAHQLTVALAHTDLSQETSDKIDLEHLPATSTP